MVEIPEERKNVICEEEFRKSLASKLNGLKLESITLKNTTNSCWAIINSPFILLLLSSVLLAGIANLYSCWQSKRILEAKNDENIREIVVELVARIDRAKNYYLQDLDFLRNIEIIPESSTQVPEGGKNSLANYFENQHKSEKVIKILNAKEDTTFETQYVYPKFEKIGFFSLVIDLNSLLNQSGIPKVEQENVIKALYALNNNFSKRIMERQVEKIKEKDVELDTKLFDDATNSLNAISNLKANKAFYIYNQEQWTFTIGPMEEMIGQK